MPASSPTCERPDLLGSHRMALGEVEASEVLQAGKRSEPSPLPQGKVRSADCVQRRDPAPCLG
eukprot:808006-Prorocentrum_minimum.AAC.2